MEQNYFYSVLFYPLGPRVEVEIPHVEGSL